LLCFREIETEEENVNKNIRIGLVLVALVLCIGFYLSPYLSVYNMRNAAERKDVDALSSYVDYPLLRESLKANFNAKMAGEAAKDQNANPFKVFGAALASAYMNPLIDALVTPENLASLMMKSKKPQLDKTVTQSTSEKTQFYESNIETTMSYKGLNRFVVQVKTKDRPDAQMELIFKRDGLISWKLASLRFP